ncbi:hypothetical protein DACRYDRAFT_101224 [Dacryopinax primogenitus]|uniref:Uncharacterized protein n=1 Tax=Dacryopinax primogenitus (strain DJM 731) TaxID=1858805 RepID=M5FR52_DACPD|nr:uncharacterized protein DACRYDRAFT_101224 [Dacryopinax primogenitus]EJT99545.1 hypothetical protein DACRYDRAFT_101224 [Dacryopinax primogenitus]
MSSLFHWNRKSTRSHKSNSSGSTLVGSDGRVSPTSTYSSKKLKVSSFDMVVLPDGNIVRVQGEGKIVPDQPQRWETVLAVAKETLHVLRGIGVQACGAGDLAAKVYGATCIPAEIDLFILTDKVDYTQVLRRLIHHNPKYFIIPLTPALRNLTPSSLDATTALQQALYYRTSSTPIRINLQLPPTPLILYLTTADITWHASFPLMPLPLVLLDKLRAWVLNCYIPAGREASLAERRRLWAEHADIEVLMGQVARARVNLRRERLCAHAFKRDRRPGLPVPEEEEELEVERWVREYITVYPEGRAMWAVLGVRIFDPPTPATTVYGLSRTGTRSSNSTGSNGSSAPPYPSTPPLPAQYFPRPSFSSDQMSLRSRPSLQHSSRSHTPIPESPMTPLSPADIPLPMSPESVAVDRTYSRASTPSRAATPSRFLVREPRSPSSRPPLPPMPPIPPPSGLAGTVVQQLRSKSPFGRKKSSRTLGKERGKEESYFDWDD